ncbi:CHAT domain-containing protein [Fusarium oxysporum Fo47]|uniref:CHAT domain-containing protein n=1 Tax=Fusarium oxysporum Fo47 TaxID=660027 RepID=UPI002869C206|nr:CHAT domain-containing protein [Fusarium oxysporum Fo47]QKD60526.2 CHAT domain-domain-containing protein [Fusarium oxysporum Fo47]
MAIKAIDLTPESHPQRTPRLINLSVYWHEKYPRSDPQNGEGLQDSIKASRDAIAALSETYPHRGTILDQLSTKLGLLFMQTRELGVIDENIAVQREAVEEDLDEAIQICHDVIAQTDENSPQLLERLGNLWLALSERYETHGDQNDLEEAIEVVKQAIEVTEEDSLERMAQLSNYANFLGDRYLRTGSIRDLEESIHIFEMVCDRIEDDELYLDRHKCLSNFGIQLSRRYRRIGTVGDLRQAIQVGRKACKLSPDDDSKSKHLSNLAIILKHEYFRTDDPDVLEEAISVQRKAVEAVHKNHPDIFATFHNLATLLTTKYKLTQNLEDLEEALRLGRLAVDLTTEDHANRAACLNTLAVQLSDMSKKTGVSSHLHEAIDYGQKALDATEESHPERASRLVNQGGRYGNLFWQTKEKEHLDAAIAHLDSALHIPDWDKAYEAVKTAMDLVPHLIAQTTSNADKQGALVQVYGLSSHSAAVALSANRGALAALRFLEQGRGLMAASVEESRMECLDLRTEQPELAENLNRFQGQISRHAGMNHDLGELHRLLDDIRQRPGFEEFLSAPSESCIKNTAIPGAIIVINTSEFRRDAIIVESDQIRSIPLPQLTILDIRSNTQQGHISSPKILEWLWHTIAEPVLGALGINEVSPEERLPRIWWIPTGVLSIYPLHAAGRHYKGSRDTVIDRAMSSYSSSVRAIIRTRSRAGLKPFPLGNERAVLTSMERTPGYNALPSAGREISQLRPICESKGFEVVEPKGIKEDIVSQFPECKVFHFAGHGATNLRDPSQSSLLLQDEPLTVSTLLETNIQQYSPFLAYLSACGTGQIAHEKFLDESIHLISAFQLAGFRHVIGTLWEVGDDISVHMARITYEAIQRGDSADESVCRGLHKATLERRDQWFREQTPTRGHCRNGFHMFIIDYKS